METQSLIPKLTKEARVVELMTRRKATRSKVTHLPKYVKLQLGGFKTKEQRRIFLNMMLDATNVSVESKNKSRNKAADTSDVV